MINSGMLLSLQIVVIASFFNLSFFNITFINCTFLLLNSHMFPSNQNSLPPILVYNGSYSSFFQIKIFLKVFILVPIVHSISLLFSVLHNSYSQMNLLQIYFWSLFHLIYQSYRPVSDFQKSKIYMGLFSECFKGGNYIRRDSVKYKDALLPFYT